jgi:two-component system, OmpR family, KDP operon response regulator KdpE
MPSTCPPRSPESAGRIVLVVEDEKQLSRFLRATLGVEGYRVVEADTGERALVAAATTPPEIVLLDLGLPDMDGVNVTRRLREWSDVPIVVISARGNEADKIQALDAGADDYLTKPFGAGELLARMRVALRNAGRSALENGNSVFETGDLRVDLALRRVSIAGQEIHLTQTEYNLLVALVKRAGKVVTHPQLLREVWGPGAATQVHYVRIYMGYLRHKLEKDPARPRYIETQVGVGYRLSAN